MEQAPTASQDGLAAADKPQVKSVWLRCPRCGQGPLAAEARVCTSCNKPVTPAPVNRGNWRTDPDHVRYVLSCVGAEYAFALVLVSLASLLVAAATVGSIDARLLLAIGIAWLALPVLLVAGELARGAWQMEFLPGFLFPLSFLSFVAGAVAVGFGNISGVAGGAPILFTILFGRMLAPLWQACRPFETLQRAILANTTAVAIACIPIMALVFLLLWIGGPR